MESDERVEQLERLFLSTFRRVRAYCLRRTDEATASDAVAEVYAIAWRRRKRVPPGEDDAAVWLLAIAHRVLANQARGQRRWSRLLRRVAEQGGGTAAVPPAVGDLGDAGDELRAALALLPAGDREVLRLAYWDELSHREIAVVLGISVGAVGTRLHRARERLRPALAPAHRPTHEDTGTREDTDTKETHDAGR
ncbi:RNA polymerase sigma factor [Streptomyces sp. NPDC087420]|uniref:RNA polymerase sigma factor n=1 Tax=Streptomyces sp. NPDC087420 TaxID=3365785 RepID=UPI00383442E1